MMDVMNFDQSEEANKQAFIERLMQAGWSKAAAEWEWNNIQDDEEGEL